MFGNEAAKVQMEKLGNWKPRKNAPCVGRRGIPEEAGLQPWLIPANSTFCNQTCSN
jgi:hypothetical protein